MAAALLGLLVLPVLPFQYLLPRAAYFYASDVLSIAIFTLGLALLLRRRWRLYFLLFLVGTFNRETTLFLVGAYVLVESLEWRSRWRVMVLHVAGQLVLWVGVKALLYAMYHTNVHHDYSGALFKVVYHRNIRDFLAEPGTILRYVTSTFAYLWIPALGCAWLIPDRRVRRLLLLLIPYGAVMFYMGLLEETRNLRRAHSAHRARLPARGPPGRPWAGRGARGEGSGFAQGLRRRLRFFRTGAEESSWRGARAGGMRLADCPLLDTGAPWIDRRVSPSS